MYSCASRNEMASYLPGLFENRSNTVDARKDTWAVAPAASAARHTIVSSQDPPRQGTVARSLSAGRIAVLRRFVDLAMRRPLIDRKGYAALPERRESAPAQLRAGFALAL